MNAPLPREAAIRAAQRFCLTPPPPVDAPPQPPPPEPEPPARITRHKAIARALRKRGEATTKMIAQALGHHNATISEELNRMMARGQVVFRAVPSSKFHNTTRAWTLTEKGKWLL